MKRKELLFLRVQKSAKYCQRVRKDVKRKGIRGCEAGDNGFEELAPPYPLPICMNIKGKDLQNLQFVND
jgi:hypothetical protein